MFFTREHVHEHVRLSPPPLPISRAGSILLIYRMLVSLRFRAGDVEHFAPISVQESEHDTSRCDDEVPAGVPTIARIWDNIGDNSPGVFGFKRRKRGSKL